MNIIVAGRTKRDEIRLGVVLAELNAYCDGRDQKEMNIIP
jgi:hypothetical protein